MYIDEVANTLQLGLSAQAMAIAGAHLRRLYKARYGTEPMPYSRRIEARDVLLYHSNDMDLVVAALGAVLCSNERGVFDFNNNDVNNLLR